MRVVLDADIVIGAPFTDLDRSGEGALYVIDGSGQPTTGDLAAEVEAGFEELATLAPQEIERFHEEFAAEHEVSLVTTAYGWLFDQIVLLPALMQVGVPLAGRAGPLRRPAIAAYPGAVTNVLNTFPIVNDE